MLFLFLALSAAVAQASVEGVQYYDGYNVEEPYKDYGEDETTKPDSQRVRRYELETNNFDPDDEDQVKGALNQIFAGRRLDEPLSPKDFTSFLDAEYNVSLSPITKINEALTLVKNWQRTTSQVYNPATKLSEKILQTIYRNATKLYQFLNQRPVSEVRFLTVLPTRSNLPSQLIPSRIKYTHQFVTPSRSTKNVKVMETPSRRTEDLSKVKIPTRSMEDVSKGIVPSRSTHTEQVLTVRMETVKVQTPSRNTEDILRQHESSPDASAEENDDTEPPGTSPSPDDDTTPKPDQSSKGNDTGSTASEGDDGDGSNGDGSNGGNSTDEGTTQPMCKMPPGGWPQPATTTTTTTTTKKTTLHFDIEKFLEIVANLTYDYYTNLTAQVNETLQKMSMKPTCPTLSPPVTDFDYMLFNDSMRGKCFVCGMDNKGIPVDANCADAFAGDFIPLVPQNPKAKGQIAQYRKYCAFRDVNNFVINKTMPRMMWGRWTGGCAVRWTDLSGVYTQRTCRSKHKAAVGKHYASKRMAKLEMALSHTDNGCIISPVATLLPLSRGISLFARFHACVCTGSWCNGSTPLAHVVVSLLVAMATSLVLLK